MSEQTQARNANIVIVEDEAVIAVDLRLRLANIGHRVSAVASTPEEAVDAVEKHRPDLVLMDIVLRGGSGGIDAAEIIRDRWNTPVVFLTAYADRERLERAKLATPFGYILKPFQERDLKVAVEMALYTAREDRKRKKVEADLAEAQRVARLGSWRVDRETNMVHCSAEIFRIFGLPAESSGAVEYTKLLEQVHPDDLALHHEAWEKLVDPAADLPVVEFEERIVSADGAVKWLRVKVRRRPDDDGNPEIFGITQDITEQKQAEESLARERHRLRQAARLAGLGYWEWDLETSTLSWSEETFRIFGRDPESFVPTAESFESCIHPDDLERFIREREEGLAAAGEMTIEHRIVLPDGSVRHVRESAEVIRDAAGRPFLVGGAVLDITDPQGADRRLRASEEQYRLLVESTGDLVLTHDGNGIITYINNRSREFSGYAPEEMIGRKVTDFLPEDQMPAVQERGASRLSGDRRDYKYQTALVDRNGRRMEIEVHSRPLFRGDEFLGVMVVVRDITERKRAEEKLAASEEQYRLLVESTGDIVFTHDENGIITFANSRGLEFSGYTLEEALGRNIIEFLPEDELAALLARRDSRHSGDPLNYHYETAFMNRRGERIEVDVRSTPLFRGETFLGEMVVARDITDRKRAEKILSHTTGALESIMESVPADIYISDFDTYEVLYMNTNMEQSFGRDCTGEICHRAFRDSAEPCRHCTNALLLDENGAPGEMVVWEDWNPVNGRYYINYDRAIEWPDGRYVRLQIATDITDRKEAEERLRDSEEKYRAIFEQSREAIYVTSREGRILEINQAASDIFGYSPEEFRRINVTDVYVDPAQRAAVAEELEREGTIRNRESAFYHKDGREVVCLDTAAAWRDADGRLIGYVGALHDITERKRAEEAVRRSLAEKELLLQEIHHRVKNNMQTISSLLNLQSSRHQDERVREALQVSIGRIAAMAAVHETTYSSQNFSEISLADYLGRLAHGVVDTAPAGAPAPSLEIRLSDDLVLSLDKATPLGLVVNEILTNAVKYSFPAGGGVITIEGGRAEGGTELVIQDNGVGLPEGFDLKQTETLGLKLITSIVQQQLGGEVQITSNGGLRFTIRLPG